MQTNCYLVWDAETQECLIVDPGEDADFISSEILNLKLKPIAILLTHGHYDHTLACLELKLNFNIPIYLNPKDNFLYQNASNSASHWSKIPVIARSKTTKQPPTFNQPPTSPFPKPLTLGKDIIEVIPIPGHTPGSVCFYSAPHLFVGDTIFEEGIGRTDFSYSSAQDLKKSIANILSFPKETLIYAGHENSPFFLSFLKNPEAGFLYIQTHLPYNKPMENSQEQIPNTNEQQKNNSRSTGSKTRSVYCRTFRKSHTRRNSQT